MAYAMQQRWHLQKCAWGPDHLNWRGPEIFDAKTNTLLMMEAYIKLFLFRHITFHLGINWRSTGPPRAGRKAKYSQSWTAVIQAVTTSALRNAYLIRSPMVKLIFIQRACLNSLACRRHDVWCSAWTRMPEAEAQQNVSIGIHGDLLNTFHVHFPWDFIRNPLLLLTRTK